jgi:phosphotransferase family enzyme
LERGVSNLEESPQARFVDAPRFSKGERSSRGLGRALLVEAVRTLHEAPLPPRPSSQCQQQPARSSRGTVECPPELDSKCRLLVADNFVSADVVRRNPQVVEAALRPWTPVLIHADLQIIHVLDDGDEASGVADCSEGGQRDAMYDLATLTLAHEEHLDDVRRATGATSRSSTWIRAYWSLRSLMEIRWLVSTATARRRRSHMPRC